MNKKELNQIKQKALEEHIPIIMDDTLEVIDKILKEIKPKKIVYVSCNPITLARDINKLSEEYKFEDIELFDMFPQTYHVESVCLLQLC